MNTFLILPGVDLIQLKEHNLQLLLFPEIQNIHFAVKIRWYLLEWHLLGLLVALCQLVCCSSTLPCICTCWITALALRGCKPAQAAACAQRFGPLTVMLSWGPQLWLEVNYVMGEAQVQSTQHLLGSDSPDYNVQQFRGDIHYLAFCQGTYLQNNREISCSGLICWINGGYWTFTEY